MYPGYKELNVKLWFAWYPYFLQNFLDWAIINTSMPFNTTSVSASCSGNVPDCWTVLNTALNSSMGIDITTYRIRIGHFGPGSGYISTGIAEIYSSSINGSDIHYRMLATMVLLTFQLKCCVMTQQEDVHTFAETDQCQGGWGEHILKWFKNA